MILACNPSSLMPDSAHPQPSPGPAGHAVEGADVSLRWIMIWLGILLASGVLIHFVLGAMLAHFKRTSALADQEAARQQVVPSVAAARRQFPEPRLQVSPPLDLAELRTREDAELNSYGWIDRTSGVVRIPIDRAIDIIAQKGVPARLETNQGGAGPSTLQLLQGRRGQYIPPQSQPKK
ncbi:MAG: hypothetical protein JWR69_3256 [Pedosphaera sp.]|nr:hypothetical protein [Pedosphaera sp.]